MPYRIKRVALLTGITTATLRAWERRYGLVEPRRSSGGYRLYTDEEVALFSRVKSLVDGGLSAGEAVEVVKGHSPEPLAGSPPDSLDELRVELLDALLALDRSSADHAWRPFLAFAPERRVDEVLLPTLREIGVRWARGEASVVQEHFASAVIREKLVGMLESLSGQGRAAEEAVCAGAPGESHELGLLSVAVHLALRGWRVTYLGMEVPVAELRPVLAARRPTLLCTSLIQPVGEGECLEYARALRRIAPPETCVAVGGTGVPRELAGRVLEGLYLLREIEELFAIRVQNSVRPHLSGKTSRENARVTGAAADADPAL